MLPDCTAADIIDVVRKTAGWLGWQGCPLTQTSPHASLRAAEPRGRWQFVANLAPSVLRSPACALQTTEQSHRITLLNRSSARCADRWEAWFTSGTNHSPAAAKNLLGTGNPASHARRPPKARRAEERHLGGHVPPHFCSVPSGH
jgi:hypothetical protein